MFPCTNNVAEYEALLHGLRMAKDMNLSRVRCLGDSDLVAQQVSGKWDSKDPLMAAYRREVDVVARHFKGYQVEHIDRRKNEAADALSRLGSQRKPVPPNIFLCQGAYRGRTSDARPGGTAGGSSSRYPGLDSALFGLHDPRRVA